MDYQTSIQEKTVTKITGFSYKENMISDVSYVASRAIPRTSVPALVSGSTSLATGMQSVRNAHLISATGEDHSHVVVKGKQATLHLSSKHKRKTAPI